MRGLEVVVRPVVFPNIRPAPARLLPPEDDPDKGKAVISSSGGSMVGTSNSFSYSMSRSKPTETERRVDEVRVYQKEDDGTINRDNFVDVEVANKIWMDEGDRPDEDRMKEYHYAPVEETDNVEIRRKDVIKKNPEVSSDSGGES
jgi:hypothetical protein